VSMTVRARNYSLAMRYLDEGLTYTTRHDLDSYTHYLRAWRARAHFEQGNWDSATDDADFVAGDHRVSASTRIPGLAVLGHLRVRRGDPDAAPVLREARELAMQTGELQRIAPVASACADFAWLKGDLEQLRIEADSVLQIDKSQDDAWIRGEFAFWKWRAGGGVERDEEIAAPYALQMSGDWRVAA